MRKIKNKRLHKEDKQTVIKFIDSTRLAKCVTVNLEIAARYIAEHIGINPNQSNARLANRFAKLFESKQIA